MPRRRAVTTGITCALSIAVSLLGCRASSIPAPGVRVEPRPYHGAVLVLAWNEGQLPSTNASVVVDTRQAGGIVESGIAARREDDLYIAELVDLMYELNVEIEIRLEVRELAEEPKTFESSVVLRRFFPWMDWILAEGDADSLWPHFRYDWPDSPNGKGCHSAWDVYTRLGRVPVYSGCPGIVYVTMSESYDDAEGQVQIYNPFVGAFVQYGHIWPYARLRPPEVGGPMWVDAGEAIGHVIEVKGMEEVKHIHFAVFRPATWGVHEIGLGLSTFDKNGVCVHDPIHNMDPYYFHEPATWGYWNSETLPDGWEEQMLDWFEHYNPGVSPQ